MRLAQTSLGVSTPSGQGDAGNGVRPIDATGTSTGLIGRSCQDLIGHTCRKPGLWADHQMREHRDQLEYRMAGGRTGLRLVTAKLRVMGGRGCVFIVGAPVNDPRADDAKSKEGPR